MPARRSDFETPFNRDGAQAIVEALEFIEHHPDASTRWTFNCARLRERLQAALDTRKGIADADGLRLVILRGSRRRDGTQKMVVI